jgi:hypothetical protein
MRNPLRLTAAFTFLCLAGCGGSSGPPLADGSAVVGGDGAINLDQGWDTATQQRAWFSSFGSRLIPTVWLQALERDKGGRFMTDDHLDALGFLVQSPTPINPRGFPVGFTQVTDADGTAWTGLGCAACHTGEVRYHDKHIRIDGGQGDIDFDGFEGELIASLQSTLADETKFTRFATALKTAPEQQPHLREQLTDRVAKLVARHTMNHVDVPYGHARMDAFGQIFNAVAVQFLGIPENKRAPDAPVSFPVLWGAPHLDVVQWNGSAPNSGPGPLIQNVTTALAVYGNLDINEHGGIDGYDSSIDFKHLGEIEDDLYKLKSPLWPQNILGALDATKVSSGAKIYAHDCVSCHAIADRDAPERELKASLTPLSEVGTDPRMVQNFLGSESATGAFEGRKQGVVVGDKFGPRAQTIDLVVHATLAASLRHPIVAVREAIAGYHTVIKAALDQHPNYYKARPLGGIWASAPYLHNGSVPTLAQLLKPPAQRIGQFYVGNREFDPQAVGLVTGDTTHASLFDTTLPGNSNAGHAYGTTLSDADKSDLLEYLKSL